MHFHLARKTFGAYFRHSTIYDSNTRFVAIHGTHGVDVSGNVAFKCFGHGFYIEDGSVRWLMCLCCRVSPPCVSLYV